MINTRIPLLGFAAYSGTGKTTLLKKLIPVLRNHGLRVGLIKLSHHNFEIDKPGKDSYELRKAGANEVILASGRRWALMVETQEQEDPDLNRLIQRLDQDNLDIILIEGGRHESLPKIELYRPSLGKPLLFPGDEHIIAVITDGEISQQTTLPILALNDTAAIAKFIMEEHCVGYSRTGS